MIFSAGKVNSLLAEYSSCLSIIIHALSEDQTAKKLSVYHNKNISQSQTPDQPYRKG